MAEERQLSVPVRMCAARLSGRTNRVTSGCLCPLAVGDIKKGDEK